jgi:PEGA domain
MKMNRLIISLSLLLLSFSVLHGQTQMISLKSIKKIFVDKMPEDLDQYIRAEITKQFKGSILVVLAPEDADAILAGTGKYNSGTGAAVTGRWLGLHDTASGSVSLLDREGKVVLWSSEAGDRSLWWGAMKRGGPRKVADRLVHNLSDAIHSDKGVPIAVNSSPSKPLAAPRVSASSTNQPNPNGGSGTLTVKSDLDGAEIEIDGKFVGNTPTTLQVAAGSHKVVVKNGAEVWKRDLQIAGGDSITVKAPNGAKNNAASPNDPPAVAATAEIAAGQSTEKTAVAASPTAQAEASAVEVGYANCGESLKEVPVSSSKMGLKSLRCGEKVTILSRSGAWIRIRNKDNAEGFVAERFIGQIR